MLKAPLEELIDHLHRRLPDFAMDIHTFGQNVPILVNWRFRMGHPMWQWQYRTPGEMMNAGTFANLRAAVEHIHGKVDRFEASVAQDKATAAEKVKVRQAHLQAAAQRQPAPPPPEPVDVEPQEE